MNIHTPRQKEVPPANVPALPRLAAKAAHDLVRSAKSISDGLRAFEAWFTQNGDPFVPLAPAAFATVVNAHSDNLDKTCAALSNAELLAMMSSALKVINARFKLSAVRDE